MSGASIRWRPAADSHAQQALTTLVGVTEMNDGVPMTFGKIAPPAMDMMISAMMGAGWVPDGENAHIIRPGPDAMVVDIAGHEILMRGVTMEIVVTDHVAMAAATLLSAPEMGPGVSRIHFSGTFVKRPPVPQFDAIPAPKVPNNEIHLRMTRRKSGILDVSVRLDMPLKGDPRNGNIPPVGRAYIDRVGALFAAGHALKLKIDIDKTEWLIIFPHCLMPSEPDIRLNRLTGGGRCSWEMVAAADAEPSVCVYRNGPP